MQAPAQAPVQAPVRHLGETTTPDVVASLSPGCRFKAAGAKVKMEMANSVIDNLVMAKLASTECPQVIISYQTTNLEFMKRLRQYLNDNGVKTVDGQLSSLRCHVLNQPNA